MMGENGDVGWGGRLWRGYSEFGNLDVGMENVIRRGLTPKGRDQEL